MTGHAYERLNTARWWFDFVGTAEKIKRVCLQGREYTMADVYYNTKRQAGSSLATIAAACPEGATALLEQLAAEAIPNKRQQMALDAWNIQCKQAKDRLEILRKQMDEGRGESYESE